MIAGITTLALMLAAPVGAWSVSDMTDNDTGERTVSALNVAADPGKDLVFLSMDCIGREPTILIRWFDLPEAKMMVLELAPSGNPAKGAPFTLRKSDDPVHSGLIFMDPEAFVKAVGTNRKMSVTAYTSYSSKTVTFDTEGTATTWKRVTDRCETDV